MYYMKMKALLFSILFTIVFYMQGFAQSSQDDPSLAKYSQLMEQADELIDEERYEEAIPLLKECHALYKNLTEFLDQDYSVYSLDELKI